MKKKEEERKGEPALRSLMMTGNSVRTNDAPLRREMVRK